MGQISDLNIFCRPLPLQAKCVWGVGGVCQPVCRARRCKVMIYSIRK